MTVEQRWQTRFGQPMPQEIAGLSLYLRERAFRLAEANCVVVVPKPAFPVRAEDSIQDWDRDEKISDPHSAGEFS